MKSDNMPMRMEVLQKNLPAIRLLLGWTRKDVADLIGISVNAYVGIEHRRMTKMQYYALLYIIEDRISRRHGKGPIVAGILLADAYTGADSMWKVDSLVFTSDEFKTWLKEYTAPVYGAEGNAERLESILAERWGDIEF